MGKKGWHIFLALFSKENIKKFKTGYTKNNKKKFRCFYFLLLFDDDVFFDNLLWVSSE